MTNHTHEYAFWHIHRHSHVLRPLPEGAEESHDTGHYHLWAQTHSHGEGIKMPHTHKDKQVHPDESFVHHHAITDHEIQEKRQTLAAMQTGNDHIRNSIMIMSEETFNDEEEMLLASEAMDAEIFEGRNPDRFKNYALPSFLRRNEQ